MRNPIERSFSVATASTSMLLEGEKKLHKLEGTCTDMRRTFACSNPGSGSNRRPEAVRQHENTVAHFKN